MAPPPAAPPVPGGGGAAGWAGGSFRARKIVLPTSMHPVHAFRAQAYAVLTDASQPVGAAILVVMTAAIVLSVVSFAVQTLPQFRMRAELGEVGEPEHVFAAIEWAMLILFSVEYMARLLTVSAVPVASEMRHLARLAAAGRRAPLLSMDLWGPARGARGSGGVGGRGDSGLELPTRSPPPGASSGGGASDAGGGSARTLPVGGESVHTWADSRDDYSGAAAAGAAAGAAAESHRHHPAASAGGADGGAPPTLLAPHDAGDTGAGTGLARRVRLSRSASAPAGAPSEARRRWGLLRDAVLGANNTRGLKRGAVQSSRALLLSAAVAFNAAPHNPDHSAVTDGDAAAAHGDECASPDAAALAERLLTSREEGMVVCGFGLTSRLPMTARKLIVFMTSPLNIIDLVAILPFYTAMGSTEGGSSDSLYIARVLRVGRIFSLLKLTRHHSGLTVMVDAMAASAHMLAFLLFFVLLAATFFGAFMYILESGEWDAKARTWKRPDLVGSELVESPFKSVPHGIYWAITTLTTTGYGDMYPTTMGGRAIACVTMLAGAMVIALPITVISANFGVKYAEFNAAREERNKMLAQWKRQARLNAKLEAEMARARSAQQQQLAAAAGKHGSGASDGGGSAGGGSAGGSSVTLLASLSPGSLLKRTLRSISTASRVASTRRLTVGVAAGPPSSSATGGGSSSSGGGGGGGSQASLGSVARSLAAVVTPPPTHHPLRSARTAPGALAAGAPSPTSGSIPTRSDGSSYPVSSSSRRGGGGVVAQAFSAAMAAAVPPVQSPASHQRVASPGGLAAAATPVTATTAAASRRVPLALAAGSPAATLSSRARQPGDDARSARGGGGGGGSGLPPSPSSPHAPTAAPAAVGDEGAGVVGSHHPFVGVDPVDTPRHDAPSPPPPAASPGALLSLAASPTDASSGLHRQESATGGVGHAGDDAEAAARHAARVRAEALARVRAKVAAAAAGAPPTSPSP